MVQVRIKDALPSEAKLSHHLSPGVNRGQGKEDYGHGHGHGQEHGKKRSLLSPVRKRGKIATGSPSANAVGASHRVQFASPHLDRSADTGEGEVGVSPGNASPGQQQLEELSVISSKILETSKKQKSKYNFHSSGISIPRMDALEVDRVLSKKQQHSPDFQRQRSQVVRVSPNTGRAKLV